MKGENTYYKSHNSMVLKFVVFFYMYQIWRRVIIILLF